MSDEQRLLDQRHQDKLLDEAVTLVRRAEVVEAFSGKWRGRESLITKLRLRASLHVAEAVQIEERLSVSPDRP